MWGPYGRAGLRAARPHLVHVDLGRVDRVDGMIVAEDLLASLNKRIHAGSIQSEPAVVVTDVPERLFLGTDLLQVEPWFNEPFR
jgi:hypothetical protein